MKIKTHSQKEQRVKSSSKEKAGKKEIGLGTQKALPRKFPRLGIIIITFSVFAGFCLITENFYLFFLGFGCLSIYFSLGGILTGKVWVPIRYYQVSRQDAFKYFWFLTVFWGIVGILIIVMILSLDCSKSDFC